MYITRVSAHTHTHTHIMAQPIRVPVGFVSVPFWVIDMVMDKKGRVRDVVERNLVHVHTAILKGDVWVLKRGTHHLVQVMDMNSENYNSIRLTAQFFMPQIAQDAQLYWNRDWDANNPTLATRMVEVDEKYIKFAYNRMAMGWFYIYSYSPLFEMHVYTLCTLKPVPNQGVYQDTIIIRRGDTELERIPLSEFDFEGNRFFMEYKNYKPFVPTLKTFAQKALARSSFPK